MKDKLRIHLTRHKIDHEYIEVVDSASFCEFGVKYLEKPGPRAGIEKRTFFDLKDEEIKQRSEEVRYIFTQNDIYTQYLLIRFPVLKL